MSTLSISDLLLTATSKKGDRFVSDDSRFQIFVMDLVFLLNYIYSCIQECDNKACTLRGNAVFQDNLDGLAYSVYLGVN